MVQDAPAVYVHVPFCASRCDYCDFATWTDRGDLMTAYVDACVAQLRRERADGWLVAADTVFFGGGTPSLLPPALLARILDEIPRRADAEVTVECNPDSVDAPKLAAYAAAGVNRVSFGVQSMRAHVLAQLGRTHDPANVTRACDAARAAGIGRVNLDLIYGTPGETVADWEATLDAALVLEPDHVSAYALTVESGTPMAQRVAAGVLDSPDDDDQACKYEIADGRLAADGFEWYEISNWARAGEECRHNLTYWSQGDYRAIGCAAHGHHAGRRWWNVRLPERYIARIAAGASPEAGHEHLDPAARADERIVLALRTRAGVPLRDLADGDVTVAELEGDRLVVRRGDRVVLTRAGRLLANHVTAALLARPRAALAVGTR